MKKRALGMDLDDILFKGSVSQFCEKAIEDFERGRKEELEQIVAKYNADLLDGEEVMTIEEMVELIGFAGNVK